MKLFSARRFAGVIASAVALATVAVGAPPAPASGASSAALGTRSLATVLAKDGVGRLDRNAGDFDLAEKAVYAVLRGNPDSPLVVLTQGRTPLTLFLPTDAAFRRLVEDLSGRHVRSEAAVWNTLRSVADLRTLEAVLLYHGTAARLNRNQVVAASEGSGTVVRTFQGGTVRVVERGGVIRLVDKDPDLLNAGVIVSKTNINQGNRQLAHGITRVLLPVNL